MSQLSHDARQQLTETVREFQTAHAPELPKCDDAYRALYPDQVTLFDFRQTWNTVVREREREAIKAAKDAELRAQVEAELRAELQAESSVQSPVSSGEPRPEPPAAEEAES